ncbi:hypothetical protein QCD60_15690 [Pokkaliibacter sp. MBI-7]|uniref:hypothetical protein n=1 Tax=Pokkaliibacter sp. MBI-7 TaxID=3040600 RepID=UPI002448E2E2|nr:hypothetical protein [Pokkaliibacter sp. MBI-7]MDH2434009.1 hypothetical protein [Pokkaliibacter sp. MBI-7]
MENYNYADFYELIDKNKGEPGYCARVYGAPINPDGSYSREEGNTPQKRDENGELLFALHYDPRTNKIMVVDGFVAQIMLSPML